MDAFMQASQLPSFSYTPAIYPFCAPPLLDDFVLPMMLKDVGAWHEASRSGALVLTDAEMEAFKQQLSSPIASPGASYFEIEPDTTVYETCYDEFMDSKLAVLKEIKDRFETGSEDQASCAFDALVSRACTPEPALPSDPISPSGSMCSDTPTLVPDDDEFDIFNKLIESVAAPSTPPSTTNIFNFQGQDEAELFGSELSFPGLFPNEPSVVDDADDEYVPFEHRRRPSKKRTAMTRGGDSSFFPQDFYFDGCVSAMSTPSRKRKRKDDLQTEEFLSIPSSSRSPKRLRRDPEVVCRVNGCRHVSKTKFECFKHRETHFPGRFQCPQPDCRKIFVRSSSLARHLKRLRNDACGRFAGPPSQWGVGLANFALFPPPWLEPGVLDNIDDADDL